MRTYRRTWRRWAERDAHRRFERFDNRRRITLIRGEGGDIVRVIAQGAMDTQELDGIRRVIEEMASRQPGKVGYLAIDDSWEVRVL